MLSVFCPSPIPTIHFNQQWEKKLRIQVCLQVAKMIFSTFENDSAIHNRVIAACSCWNECTLSKLIFANFIESMTNATFWGGRSEAHTGLQSENED